jgi:hypothetical protein
VWLTLIYIISVVSELQTWCVPVCKHAVSGFVLKVGVAERLMSQLGVDTLGTVTCSMNPKTICSENNKQNEK